jgi:hypothetical protein
MQETLPHVPVQPLAHLRVERWPLIEKRMLREAKAKSTGPEVMQQTPAQSGVFDDPLSRS